MDFVRRFGLPVIALVVVIAWALFAVLMLTGTLVAAQQIDNRVRAINTEYPKIGENLQTLPLAFETGRIADEISKAAQPVGPQFTQIVATVGTIESSVKSIEGNALNINTSVHSINDSVHSINTNVREIDSSLNSINDSVASINASAHDIDDSLAATLGVARSIDDTLAVINGQAATVIDTAGGIKHNLGKVRDPLVPDIVKNSTAIAAAPILQLPTVPPGLLLPGLEAPPLLDPTAPLVVGPPAELQAASAAGPLGPGLVPEGPALLGPDGGADPSQGSPLGERDREKKKQDGLLGPLGGLTGG
jgi:hypothetical protein